MKKIVAMIASSFAGMCVGVVLWTILCTILLAIYWIGYIGIYLGVICGQPGGKGFGLGLLDPPENPLWPMEHVLVGTAIAFTWGEVFAAILGAMCGFAMAYGGIRVFSWLFRKSPPKAAA